MSAAEWWQLCHAQIKIRAIEGQARTFDGANLAHPSSRAKHREGIQVSTTRPLMRNGVFKSRVRPARRLTKYHEFSQVVGRMTERRLALFVPTSNSGRNGFFPRILQRGSNCPTVWVFPADHVVKCISHAVSRNGFTRKQMAEHYL